MTGSDQLRQNVVLVTVDSLRADHCGFMSYDQNTTPNLDSMAREGLVFKNAVAPGPSTSESMPAIFTGHYPVDRRSPSDAIDDRIERVRPHMRAHTTIAEEFRDAGYVTAGFTPNPFTTRYFGFDEGFDHYRDFLQGSRKAFYQRLLESSAQSLPAYMPVRVLLNWLQREEVFKPWESFYEEVVRWTERQDRPYFLWVFLMDVHHPYLPARRYRSESLWRALYANWRLRAQEYEPPFSDAVHESLVTAYDDAIEYADAFLGRLRRDLADDDPLLVVTADHGEAFGEHDSYEHHGGAFGEHGDQEYNSYLYEENLHVPLVAYNAGREGTVERPVSLRSLKEILAPGARGVDVPDPPPEAVTAQTMDGNRVAARGERWKLIVDGDGRRLYDLAADEQTTVDDETVETELSRYVARRRQTTEECERIVAAGESLSANERL